VVLAEDGPENGSYRAEHGVKDCPYDAESDAEKSADHSSEEQEGADYQED